MAKKIIVVFFVFFIIFIITLTFFLFPKHNQFRDSTTYFNIKAFGNLSRNNPMISGPGDYTLAPYLKIPKSKFYVTIIQDDDWCINEGCGLEGAFIQTMGGWLQMETTKGNPDIEDEIGFDFSADKNIKPLLLVGDKNGKIAGIYLNKNLKNILAILKNHSDLADFDLLPGVNEFGKLKVGEVAPLKPSDHLFDLFGRLPELPDNFPASVPDNKNFYIYALQKRKYDIVGINKKYENKYNCFLGSCRYPEPDSPHDFLFADIEELNGWFLANSMDNIEMIRLFGLNPEEVLAGKTSLVVVTDGNGIIRALHPGKTLSDTFTILSQMSPDFYRQFKFNPGEYSNLPYLKRFLKWEIDSE